MTYAEQLAKLSRDIPGVTGGYTKDELLTLYRCAKEIMLYAACDLADYELRRDEESDE